MLLHAPCAWNLTPIVPNALGVCRSPGTGSAPCMHNFSSLSHREYMVRNVATLVRKESESSDHYTALGRSWTKCCCFVADALSALEGSELDTALVSLTEDAQFPPQGYACTHISSKCWKQGAVKGIVTPEWEHYTEGLKDWRGHWTTYLSRENVRKWVEMRWIHTYVRIAFEQTKTIAYGVSLYTRVIVEEEGQIVDTERNKI